MLHVKPAPMFDPHVARNQCKLIWDSTAGPRHKLPVKKKVGFLNTSGGNVAAPVNQNRNLRRNSLVATRISFYEEKVDTETKEDGSPETREVQVKKSAEVVQTCTVFVYRTYICLHIALVGHRYLNVLGYKIFEKSSLKT